MGRRDGKMIATVIEKHTLNGIAAPRVITFDRQNERYIAALLELKKRSSKYQRERL
jgi:hypothetical protein